MEDLLRSCKKLLKSQILISLLQAETRRKATRIEDGTSAFDTRTDLQGQVTDSMGPPISPFSEPSRAQQGAGKSAEEDADIISGFESKESAIDCECGMIVGSPKKLRVVRELVHLGRRRPNCFKACCSTHQP